jgi:DNA-binding NarL/FixJ family response regulator
VVGRGRGGRRRAVSVCVYWFHPLLLTEFQQPPLLNGVRLISRRLEADGIPDAQNLSCPTASIYVVESHSRRVVTESLVLAIGERVPGARILVVGEKFNETNAIPLLRLGVKGLLTYSEVRHQWARAREVVSAGGFWVPRALLSVFLDKIRDAQRARHPALQLTDLTERERQVLDGVLQNLLNKEIAKKLQISERTAKFHVSNLLAKFGVRRRADLILLKSTSDSAL